MILKASQRGGGSQLADHLMNANDNDHITVHEVSGFMADDVHGAFRESQAISKGTKCKQYLFSLSLSPPPSAEVTPSEYEHALAQIEDKLGLKGQPRVIVFHEKENRIHAHAVWSRIDADKMTAINLPFFKRKLMEVSRDIYLEKGWPLPSGFLDHERRDPLNYSLEEYQQAKRMERNPRLLKAAFKACWDQSRDQGEFNAELKRHGFMLARGDRRGFVAVNMTGEVLSLSRWLGIKAKELKAKLGDKDKLRPVSDVSIDMAQNANKRAQHFEADLVAEFKTRIGPLLAKRKALIKEQADKRLVLQDRQSARSQKERLQRQTRFRTGVKGLSDRVTGRHKETIRENERDALACQKRDMQERHELRIEQLKARRHIVSRIRATRDEHEKQMASLQQLFAKREVNPTEASRARSGPRSIRRER